MVEGSEEAIRTQTDLTAQQTSLKEAIQENIKTLSQEKRVIESRQKEIKKHSTEVRKDLGEAFYSIRKIFGPSLCFSNPEF